MTRRLFHLASLALALAFAAGCAGTQQRYEEGADLEARGRYEEAARYYIKALDQEPGRERARKRLLETGTRAVEGLLAEAEAAERQGHYAEAVQVLGRLDTLRARAADVAVALPVPEDYAAYRAHVTEQAVAVLLRRGEQAERTGDWGTALDVYAQAERAYALPEAQHDALTRRRAEALLRWGEEALGQERYRTAFGRAQQAIDLLGPDSPEAQTARLIQEDALAAGTRYVTFLPPAVRSSVTDSVPAGLLRDLSDVLHTYWEAPPPFLAQTDPVRLRRELRRTGPDREPLTRRHAVAIGRTLSADYVISIEVDAFERKEVEDSAWTRQAHVAERKDHSPTSGRPAAEQAHADTAYTEAHLDVTLEAAIAYRIIDPHTRRVLDESAVRAEVSGELRRGRFDSDSMRLAPSDEERAHFDQENQRAREVELEAELIDALAERLAHHLYGRLLERID